MFSAEQLDLARRVLDRCRAEKTMLATAESCTGGLIAACLTEIPGSSDVLDRGFVTYSNESKQADLGVDPDLIVRHGAVSEPVARAMAEGAIKRSQAALAVSCSGVAGPGGGSVEKPVGLVHIACARSGRATIHWPRSYGNIGRSPIRSKTLEDALTLVLRQLGDSPS
jgi:nicotinamide-nucleotide amidase